MLRRGSVAELRQNVSAFGLDGTFLCPAGEAREYFSREILAEVLWPFVEGHE